MFKNMLIHASMKHIFTEHVHGSECLPLTAESELPVLRTALHMPEEIRPQSWS